jgi:uncharacterized protein YjbI with pentapeptide repeats
MIRRSAALLLSLVLPIGAAAAQSWDHPTVFDLKLGAAASQIPSDGYVDFACGTNGGPPSRPIAGFTDFALCKAEPSGLHEVAFRYDDELEYVARAHDKDYQIALFEGTTAYSHPVIVSALFDDAGILQGTRIVTDPRVSVEQRMQAAELSNFLGARYDVSRDDCTDDAPAAGEQPIAGSLIKRTCVKTLPDGSVATLRVEHLRRPGQSGFMRNSNKPTEGEFWSLTRLDIRRTPDPQADARTAAAARAAPPAAAADLARLHDCEGCSLAGSQLKRADLAGARLPRADLSGANLHAAILRGADLRDADLSGANLNRADLRQADLRGATLKGAMLYGARLEGAVLDRADLSEAMLQTAQLTRASLKEATITLADARQARFADADLSAADLSGSRFDGVQGPRLILKGAKAPNAVFAGAMLRGARLNDSTFTGTDFYGADLGEADLSGADFARASLHTAILLNAVQDGTGFAGATMPDGSTRQP